MGYTRHKTRLKGSEMDCATSVSGGLGGKAASSSACRLQRKNLSSGMRKKISCVLATITLIKMSEKGKEAEAVCKAKVAVKVRATWLSCVGRRW